MSIVCKCDICNCELPNSPESAFKIGLGGTSDHMTGWRYFVSGDMCAKCMSEYLLHLESIGLVIKEKI